MENHPSTPSEQLDEELVAYLDGQLDAEAARRIEHRLAADGAVRRRLQQLAQSWDLLDQLPRVTVDEEFSHNTLEVVAQAAEEEVEQQATHGARRHWVRWVAAVACVLLAGAVGFLLVGRLRGNPNHELLRDLPVIENVEQYRQAGDIDFLRKLHDEGIFPEETGDAQ